MGTVTTILSRQLRDAPGVSPLSVVYATADLAVMALQQALIDGGHGGDDVGRLTRAASAEVLRRWEHRGTVAHYICAEPVEAASLKALAAEVRRRSGDTEGVLWEAVFQAQGVA